MDEEPRFGWYAHPPPGATPGPDPAPSPRRSVEQARRHPYPVRMFTETCCAFALWGPLSERPPTGPDVEEGLLESQLPISAGVREGILTWARDYDRYDRGDRSISMDGFDRRGFDLSRELQRELGELYTVQFHFTFAGDRSDLRKLAEQDVVPGWRVSRWD
jgi:hypothetical protein